MFTHILVPLDGSERAERAVVVAARIAQSADARLTLLQANTYPASAGVPYAGPVPTTPSFDEEQRRVADYLARIARWPGLRGVRIATRIVIGPAAAAILETARDGAVDLIVMSSHGRGGPTRWALGSVAEHIARHASAPVLVLRESGRIAASQHAALDRPLRVLVPLDGSNFAEGAIIAAANLITALAAPARGALHLMLVLSPYETDRANMPDALAQDGARAYLQRMVVRLQVAYPDLLLTWSVASDLDVAAALIHAAEVGDGSTPGRSAAMVSDVIAMATHGYSGLAHLALGSITERVLHGTKLPLLIVRPVARVKLSEHAEAERAESTAKPIDMPWIGLF
jgi:nucleotide-binding universal stress UspA family protein